MTPVKASLLPLLLTIAGVSTGYGHQHPGQTRPGYSYFGLGYEILDYEENTTRQIAGETVDIETIASVNFTQQSGAYVAIDPVWGFYLATASTLGESAVDEEWQIRDTTVRTNRVSFERQRLSIIGTRRLRSAHYLLFGGQYGSVEFKRFAGEFTAAAADFGIDPSTFTSGAVSEKVWDVSSMLGYEFNTFYTDKRHGWRYQVQGLVGLPLVTSITNTDVNDGEAFIEHFNGLQLRVSLAAGYQFSEHFLAAAGLEYGYARRDALGKDFVDESGSITELPENILQYLYPSFVMNWSF